MRVVTGQAERLVPMCPAQSLQRHLCPHGITCREREILIVNLLVRVHWIIEMIVVERPCAMGV